MQLDHCEENSRLGWKKITAIVGIEAFGSFTQIAWIEPALAKMKRKTVLKFQFSKFQKSHTQICGDGNSGEVWKPWAAAL